LKFVRDPLTGRTGLHFLTMKQRPPPFKPPSGEGPAGPFLTPAKRGYLGGVLIVAKWRMLRL